MMDVTPIDKSYIIETTTGNRTSINFYAQDGAFSPDSNQLALGTGYRFTIWNVSDILGLIAYSRAVVYFRFFEWKIFTEEVIDVGF